MAIIGKLAITFREDNKITQKNKFYRRYLTNYILKQNKYYGISTENSQFLPNVNMTTDNNRVEGLSKNQNSV